MIKNYKIITLGLVVAFLLGSCAFTETTSFSDPDFMGKQYKKFCVNSTISDFDDKKHIENNVVKYLRQQGYEAMPGYKLFPPTRDWDDKTIESTLREKGYDAYLLVSISDKHVEVEKSAPEVVTETKGKTTKTKRGEVYKETTKTTVKDGDEERKLFANFKTDMIDVKTSRVAWTATSKSEGMNDDFETVAGSFAEDIVNSLAKDGHIKIKK